MSNYKWWSITKGSTASIKDVHHSLSSAIKRARISTPMNESSLSTLFLIIPLKDYFFLIIIFHSMPTVDSTADT